MEKAATINLRVNPEVKHDAESVLATLGIPMSTAVNMFLRQVALTHSIPFPLSVPQAPARLDLDKMSDEELAKVVRRGLAEAESGLGKSVSDVRASLL